MQILKYLLVLFIGLGIGFLNKKTDAPPTCEGGQCQEKLNALTEKFEKISKVDIEEYLQLKDMKAKYEKADEIFGKILAIFLLDLGLRVSEKQIADLKENRAPWPTEKPQASLPNPTVEPNPTRRPESPRVQRKAQVNTRSINSDEEVKKLLEDNALDNPLSTWGNAGPLSRPQFHQVRGRFVGQITFFDKEKVPWEVEMELINANFNKGEIKAEYLLKTVDPSNPKYRDVTTATAGSTIKSFRSSDDGALLVEAMGADGIFQLYYFPQLRSLQGNVYEKRGLEQFKRTGTIVLNKR